MDKRRKWITVAAAFTALTGIACESEGPATPGIPTRDAGGNDDLPQRKKPNPDADPAPPTGMHKDNVEVPVTVTCQWRGRRWMSITVGHNGRNQPTREVKYTDDGVSSDPKSGGGTWQRTLKAKRGDRITIKCAPQPDRVDGFNQCSIYAFNVALPPDGYMHKQSGTVECRGNVPS